MTQISSDIATKTRDRIDFLPLVAVGLLSFVIWKSSGMSLGLSPEVPDVKEMEYAKLEDAAAGGASIIEILTWSVFGIIGLLLQIVNKNRALFTWSRAWPLVVLLGIVALSVLWSAVPDIALRRVVRQLLLIAVVAGVVMGARSPGQIVRLSVLLTGLMLGIDFAAVLLFPAAATSTGGDFRGLHDHKNTAGQFAMVTVFVWFAAIRWSSGAWTRGILICGTLVWFLFLLGTDSRTSIISTVAAILFVIPLRFCLRKPIAGVIFCCCILLISLCTAFALIAFNISFSDIVALIEGEKTTLTGRTLVWQIAYNAFLDHKLLGVGFGSLWLTGALAPVEQYTNLPPTPFLLGLTQAHSGYFDILAALGIVGTMALFVFLASFIWTNIRALASTDRSQDGALLAELSAYIIFGSLIYNLTQSTFLAGNVFWMFLVLCHLMLCSFRSPIDPEFT